MSLSQWCLRKLWLIICTNPLYENYVHTTKSGKRLIYVQLTKAMYGCIKAAQLFWENLTTQLKKMGFVINDYSMCMAYKTINGKQCTICWHIDDLKMSHVFLFLSAIVTFQVQ